MADGLVIDIDVGDVLQRALDDAVRRLDDPSVLFDRVGMTLRENIESRFNTKTAPDGTPWLPLAASTRARYNRQDTKTDASGKATTRRQGTLLERTGQMRDSVTHNAGRDYVEVGMSRMTADGKWSIPTLHEFGTQTMPRRQLLTDDPVSGTLGRGDVEDIQATIADYLALG
jgi:phage gpG-like protein